MPAIQPVLYRLYIKWLDQTRFSPVDWKAGQQVGNLIYATLFTAEEMAVAKTEITTHNHGRFTHEFRKV